MRANGNGTGNWNGNGNGNGNLNGRLVIGLDGIWKGKGGEGEREGR